MTELSTVLQSNDYSFISKENKRFIVAFDKAMDNAGYYTDGITDGICWGKYMLIYRKAGVRAKTVYARVYIREKEICLRLFLSNVTKHSEYIANAPEFINTVFTGEYGSCRHCRGDNCKFRKDYEIGGVRYEKCNGVTFEFRKPTLERLPEYMDLFNEFFNKRKVQ